MTPADRTFVLFRTDLFVFQQRDEDIDQWSVGGDCAGWFYARLLSVDPIRRAYEPAMEDWGWTFAVAVDAINVWVNVWAFSIDNCWLFGVEGKKRLFRRQSPQALKSAKDAVCNALDAVMAHDPRIVKRQWYEQNPFDLGVREF